MTLTSHGWRILLVPVVIAMASVALISCGGGSDLAESQTPTTTVFVTQTVTQTMTQTVSPPSSPSTAPTATRPAGGGTGSASSPFSLRTTAPVGSAYAVSVKSVDLDADTIIEATNEFNDPPNGRYVLMGLGVEYVGTKEGTPWIDLTFKFVGTDARQYDENSCSAVVPHESTDVPTLEHGGKANFQVCFDVPPSAIAGGKIFVEESFSFDETRVYWQSK